MKRGTRTLRRDLAFLRGERRVPLYYIIKQYDKVPESSSRPMLAYYWRVTAAGARK